MGGIYGVGQKSVNLKHSLILLGIFRLKPVNNGMSQLHAFFLIQLL